LRNKAVSAPLERKAPALAPQIAALTRDLPSEDARLDSAIAARVDAYTRATAGHPDIRALDSAHGEQLYKQTCAACHRLKNEGGNIGPNLDGVARAASSGSWKTSSIPIAMWTPLPPDHHRNHRWPHRRRN